MLLGCFSTLLIKETKRKTLEELAEDDDYVITAAVGSHNTTVPDRGALEERNGDTAA